MAKKITAWSFICVRIPFTWTLYHPQPWNTRAPAVHQPEGATLCGLQSSSLRVIPRLPITDIRPCCLHVNTSRLPCSSLQTELSSNGRPPDVPRNQYQTLHKEFAVLTQPTRESHYLLLICHCPI
ncbi:hypothetical protein I7I50_03523 [Histoplasma capsulatum G186AR]|uniref:Uncharacterized protein n=1 Tax=Ajellomyces capsulatus TaxID=5037 RepID=A0A8H7YIV0_AJECA|nr:hypothetical protein I7I52_04430 [Histoplasma capsulatum]QSS74649.1 hypothetical protein I7I50_03523 [Histoplasma capsulatum G186AR]